MDDLAWGDYRDEIENNGCLLASDAVSGRALLIENRSFVAVSSHLLSGLGTKDFSLSLWFKMLPEAGRTPIFTTPELDGMTVIFAKQSSLNGISFGVSQGKLIINCFVEGMSNELTKNVSIPQLDRGALINDNHWHHFVLLRRERTYEYWLDGVLELAILQVIDLDLSNQSFALLGSGPDGRQCFEGRLDEFTIENRAWSQTEIIEALPPLNPVSNKFSYCLKSITLRSG